MTHTPAAFYLIMASHEPVQLPVILDGTFFAVLDVEKIAVTASDHHNRKIRAKCIQCGQVICGQLNATTNFKTHLTVG